MAFVHAMSATTLKSDLIKLGVNGANVYTEEGVGDLRVSLFTMLTRGLEASYIDDNVDKIFKRGIKSEIRDLFVMAFQLRDIRGGKGERCLFYAFIKSLYKHDSVTTIKLLEHVPEYGCWRDLWEILKIVPELKDGILTVVRKVFIEDLAKAHSDQKDKMSLLAKWLPREGSGKYPGMAHMLANVIYDSLANCNSNRKRIIQYRKDVSFMNKILKTVEINMCNGTWRNIKPDTVPGRSLKIHSKAFLNEATQKDRVGEIRFPTNEDRMECRQHFQEFIESVKKGVKKVHGANVIMPHELVIQALSRTTSDDVLNINQAQWEAIRNETLMSGGLGKCVAMCDFSGSMNGIPKLVSLALGILISEINHSAFRDHILTFDETPVWHSFSGKNTLIKKLQSVHTIGQGLNTDFYKACMCIIMKMKHHRVPIGEEPEDLIVLTDMGFDDASYNNSIWDTQIEQIRKAFKKAGEEVWGEGQGWKPPRIVIWNLRAEYKDFHAVANQEGVVQLSGWSPSILKILQTKGIQVATPYQGMRAILDNVRYDSIRKVWDDVHSLA